MSQCGHTREGYLSPRDREEGHEPMTLVCGRESGHPGSHVDAFDRMPFGSIPFVAEQCASTMHDIHCIRDAGHLVGTNVRQDPENTHWGRLGIVRWTDAAADEQRLNRFHR